MSAPFLRKQIAYQFRSLPQRKRLRHKLLLPRDLFRLLVNYAGLRAALSRPAPPPFASRKKCTVVLLSHNRPQNISVLAQCALRNGFVRKLIVSNSNRNVRIADWVSHCDNRLVLVDETRPTLPGHRFVIADQEPGDYFLSIDDDIFLTPRQWAAFFERLVRDEDAPHGITGQIYRPGVQFTNGSEFHHRESVEEIVDVLIGAYAFTRKQLERLFVLARAIGINCLSDVGNGEDILLSFAGVRAPRIHDLGRVFLCASTSLSGVALWTTRKSFWEERHSLLEQVMAARQTLDAPWATRENPAPIPA